MADEIIVETTSTEVVEIGTPGPQGATGQGVPVGGTTGQVLRKASGTNYDTEWATGGAGGGVSSWNDLEDKPATFPPSSHASTHHTGGTDAIAPNNISAAWQQTISSLSLGNTTHTATAGRNQLILLTLTNSLGAGIILPDTGNAEGDRFAVRLDEAVSQGVTIRTINYSLVVSGPNVGRTRSFIYTSGAWVEFPLTESHSHATGDISGTWGPTFAVSRGSSLTNGPFTFDQSWGFAGTTFTALQVNVTDTASAAGSLLQDWQVGGSSVASINKSGAGAFRTLSANNGTLTASAPVLDLSQTWNNAAVTFSGARIDITNTASATGSRFLDCIVGGAAAIRLARIGSTPYALFGTADTGIGAISTSQASIIANGGVAFVVNSGSGGAYIRSDASYAWASGTNLVGASSDLTLARDAADTLAQRRGANAQTFRLYSTFSSTTNFERLNIIAQSAASVIIGTEKGSAGGTARGLELRTDNTARITIGSAGQLGFFGATAAAQPTAVADATDAATVITQLNALLSRMRTIGLIAT